MIFPQICFGDIDCFFTSVASSLKKLEAPKKSYGIKNVDGSKNEISFSYEIEYSLVENPSVVNYYKLPDISDADWLKLPQDERVAMALEKQRSITKQGTVVLVKMNDSPEFLPKKMVYESRNNLEMIDNPIKTELGKINENLDWIWENIGPGSIQGHLAFDKEGVRLLSTDRAISFDYDISQAESLVKGYQSYKIKGDKGNPGANLSHPSLGPVTNETMGGGLRRKLRFL